jgi:Kef-type K+ transport system membrane component KefB
MNSATSDLAHLLAALVVLLGAAHGMGWIFRRLKQPVVVGEIVGGLMLGPTVLGALFPQLAHFLFSAHTGTVTTLGSIQQLGLLLLMYGSGTEVQARLGRGEGRVMLHLLVFGTVIPFFLTLAFFRQVDPSPYLGAAGSAKAFLLVAAIGVSVISIPVISRIFHDLKILHTPFARLVLGVALIEDVILYTMLSVTVGMVGIKSSQGFGIPALLGSGREVYHLLATPLLFLGCILLAPTLLRCADRWRCRWFHELHPVALLIMLLLAVTLLAILLGIPPMYGAFVAGIATGAYTRGQGDSHRSLDAIKGFSLAFFVPIYFAMVGLHLNLLSQCNWAFTILFIAFACVAKAGSVLMGARFAGKSGRDAWNLAVALNARGGPGIVLASVALNAAIISERFHTTLVLLSILTSLMAGAWLARALAHGHLLRNGFVREN